jgi:sulfotransferase
LNIVFLTGLPRSGSTLLCSILSQNKKIAAGRISNLCDVMWSAQTSLNNYASISGVQATNNDLILSELPKLYYFQDQAKVIFDQCRAWTLPANLQMIIQHITYEPKIVCLTREIKEIEQSYVDLFARNGRNDFVGSAYENELIRNVAAVEYAKKLPQEWVHWIDYNDLVESTESVLDGIYSFIGQERFDHDLENIVCDFSDSESSGGLIGLHDVRKQIGFRDKKDK